MSEQKRARVTRDEVARAAGVSGYTVSQALAGKRGVSAPVAERVRREAERLGYRPNAAAALLAGQRRNASRLLPVAVDMRTDASGRNLELTGRELGLEVHRLKLQQFKTPALAERVLWARGIRGIVIGSDQAGLDAAFLSAFRWERFSVVQGMRQTPLLRGHVVRHSAFEYMKFALNETLSRGYRSIAVVLMKTASEEDDYAREAALLAFQNINAPKGIACRWTTNFDNVRLTRETKQWLLSAGAEAIIVFQWSMIYDLLAWGLQFPGPMGLAAVYADQPSTPGLPRVSGGDAANEDLLHEKLRLVRELVLHGETGFTHRPIVRVLEPTWVEGETLPHRRLQAR